MSIRAPHSSPVKELTPSGYEILSWWVGSVERAAYRQAIVDYDEGHVHPWMLERQPSLSEIWFTGAWHVPEDADATIKTKRRRLEA